MAEGNEEFWTPDIGAGRSPTIRAAGVTHTGAVRTHNEDSWFIGPPVYVVADGMGGHSAGDVASALVVEAFTALAGTGSVTLTDVEQVVQVCRDSIAALAKSPDDAPGSTVIVAGFIDQGAHGYWLFGNVGDSRAYLLTDDGLEQVSRDHSLVQELVDAGRISSDEARVHPERHVVTRALGAMPDSDAEFVLLPVVGGSRVLLCSDGLTGEVGDARIEVLLRERRPPADTADRLVAAALEAGGHDNVTAVVLDVVTPGTGEIEATTLGHAPVESIIVDTVPTGRKGS